jgi:hypothetical protein
MLIRRFTDFVLRGRFQSMGAAFVLGFIPVIGLVSSLIATLVTLRKGAQEGALVFVAATLPILLVYAGMSSNHLPAESISPIDVVIMISSINAIAWISALILRQFSSWSFVLDVVGLLSVIVIVALHLAYPGITEWWQSWLTNYFHAVGLNDNAHAMANMVMGIKDYATGLVTIMLSFYAVLTLLVARWWQDAIFNPGGLRQELMSVRLSYLLGTVFLICMVLSFWNMPIVMDVVPVLYMIFGLAGLSLLHYTVKAINAKWWLLAVIYGVLSLIPQSIIIVAMAGLLDTGFDFRKRLPVKNSLIR